MDAFGRDYNSDGKGAGFNAPSLLGAHATPLYFHNGAAESLLDVLANARHRTALGQSDILQSTLDQTKLFAFIDYIDGKTLPFLPLSVQQNGNNVVLNFETLNGTPYNVTSRTTVDGPATIVQTATGNGQRMAVTVPISSTTQFFQVR